METYPHVSSIQKYLYASVRWKQPSRTSFRVRMDTLLCSVCDIFQLVPIFSWRTGRRRVVKTLEITVGGGRFSWDSEARARNFAPRREAIRSWLEFTLLPVHGDMFSCLFHTMNIAKHAFHWGKYMTFIGVIYGHWSVRNLLIRSRLVMTHHLYIWWSYRADIFHNYVTL